MKLQLKFYKSMSFYNSMRIRFNFFKSIKTTESNGNELPEIYAAIKNT